MQKYENTIEQRVEDGHLAVVAGASVTVKTYPALATATIYSDNGITTQANPIITDAYGRFSFYAADGRYALAVEGDGIVNQNVSDILLEDPADLNPTPGPGAFTTLVTTGNVTLGDATTDTLNVGAGGIIKDASGNVGIGVTPATAAVKTLQVSSAVVFDYGINNTIFGSNCFYNGVTNRYINSSFASQYQQYAGGHAWYTAPSGTAGGIITLTQAMTLDVSGLFIVGSGINQFYRSATGNIGIGVTPDPWVGAGSLVRSIQGDSWAIGSGAGTDQSDFATNAYRDAYASTWKYRNTTTANFYEQNGNGFYWYKAPSGTAGTAVTWTQVLAIDKDKTLALQGATTAAGCGVAFPSTQVASSDANTLDDYREESFTGTLTGCTTSPTGTISYVRVGRMVTLSIDSNILATSNSTACTITGGPVGMRPTVTRTGISRIQDNGANAAGAIEVTASGVINLYPAVAGGNFTSSGSKGAIPFSFSYII